MKCPNCGQENPEDYSTCSDCGTPREESAPAAASEVVAAGSGPEAHPGTEAAAAKGKKSGTRKWILLGGCAFFVIVAMIAGIGAGVIWFLQRNTGDHILLGYPDRDEEFDLYLQRLGQDESEARLIAEQVSFANNWFIYQEKSGNFSVFGDFFGGFLPNSGDLLFWYLDEDDESIVNRMGIRDKEPAFLFDSDSLDLNGRIFDDGQKVLFTEFNDDQVTCYLSTDGNEAERIVRASDCRLSVDGSTLFVSDWDAGSLTLAAMKPDGEDEVELLDDAEDISSWDVSFDGSRVAYLAAGETQQLVLLNRDDGQVFLESEEAAAIVNYGFAPGGAGFYYAAENQDGDLELFVQEGNAFTLVDTAISIGAVFSPDGRYLGYMTVDEDGDEVFSVYDISGKQTVESYQGENLQFSALFPHPYFLVQETDGEEITISSISQDGGTVTRLFEEDNFDQVYYAFFHPDTNRIFLELIDEDGLSSLFTASLDREDGVMLIEEWDQINIYDLSEAGDLIILDGREETGDDSTLYSLEVSGEGSPIELDDDFDEFDTIFSATLSANESQVLYNVSTGDDPDEVEVRQTPVDGGEPPAVLFEEAYLLTTQWSTPEPFTSNFVAWQIINSGISYCPAAPTLSLGQPSEAELEAGETNCYRFQAQGSQLYTINVDSTGEIDTTLTLYDREGNEIDFNDDGLGSSDPLLRINVEEGGTYFLEVEGFSSDAAGEYEITVSEGLGEPAFEQAATISIGETIRGTITSNSELILNTLDTTLYGDSYKFEGQAGDQITIDVIADSIGSEMDPEVGLFDPLGELIDSDDDSGVGLDSQLSAELPQSGWYYILVVEITNDYGREDNFYYEISLTEGLAEPVAEDPAVVAEPAVEEPAEAEGILEYGDTISDQVTSPGGDSWTFTGQAGEIVTISMDGDSSLDSILDLLGPNGAALISNDDSGGGRDSLIQDYRLPTSGTYTIVARSYSGGSGSYTLQLTGNSSTEIAESIDYGDVVEGNVSTNAGDYYTFEGTQGDVITISMTADGGFDTYLQLLGPDGAELTNNDDYGSGRDSRIEDYRLPTSGTYTIIARGYSGGTGVYILSLDK